MRITIMANIALDHLLRNCDAVLTAPELAMIKNWLAARAVTLASRDIDDIHRAVDHMNLTTHWAQSRATDADLDAVTDALLLAMHDLRAVLVRKKSDRLLKDTSRT